MVNGELPHSDRPAEDVEKREASSFSQEDAGLECSTHPSKFLPQLENQGEYSTTALLV